MTRRQQLFATEYLKRGNATEAAVAAGYSERRAAVQGSTLLRHPQVAKFIEARQDSHVARLDLHGVADDSRNPALSFVEFK